FPNTGSRHCIGKALVQAFQYKTSTKSTARSKTNPPKERHRRLTWTRSALCSHQLCKQRRETVSPPPPSPAEQFPALHLFLITEPLFDIDLTRFLDENVRSRALTETPDVNRTSPRKLPRRKGKTS
ncbi:hypothetical protein MAR_001949, partial [Mya arenaria]